MASPAQQDLDLENVMPGWRDDLRAIPNDFVRCALFRAVQRTKQVDETMHNKSQIASFSDTIIRYTGPELTQFDCNVFMAILHLLRAQKSNRRIETSLYHIVVHLLGLSRNAKIYNEVKNSAERMRASAIHIEKTGANGKKMFWTGGLIDEFAYDENTDKLVILVSSRIAKLFEPGRFTTVDHTVRRSLSRHSLSMWLQLYLCSHRRPYPIKIETLRNLSGHSEMPMFRFRALLSRSVEKLVESYEKHGVECEYALDKNKLFFQFNEGVEALPGDDDLR